MLEKIFHKKDVLKEEFLYAPMTGNVKKLEEVPDPMFAERMIGDGIAVEPEEGIVVAPIDGEVIEVFPTKHAIGMRGASGLECLIHIGLETVTLDGEGFEVFVKQGDRIKAGTRLVQVNLDILKERAISAITPVIITNGDVVDSIDISETTEAIAGETKLLHIQLK